ncbi:glycoside hydrolase family 97 protein [Echinicola shivajiensis]|uniref:glycoside hydrolase family 97 protein n=1 Tax=Echinicola shivajiensis TaxID=1035916 RepID=UPI001BFC2815|nr:glycoside hydrolase family 97 protein [Echinicola shivajiensis]
MPRNFVCLLVGLLLWNVSLSSANGRNLIELSSPTNKLEIIIQDIDGFQQIDIYTSAERLMGVQSGRFVFQEGELEERFIISEVKMRSGNEEWKPVYGEKNKISNHYNEKEVTLTSQSNPNKTMKLICRVYDEGIAFRYVFESGFQIGDKIINESTRFDLDNNYAAWITAKSQGEYKKENLEDLKGLAERPLVIERNSSSYLAIGEAALVDYARMKLSKSIEGNYSLVTKLDGDVVISERSFATPWRFVMLGESPGELLENNYFVLNLNDPNQLEDVSWIRPGKVLREVTLTTQGAMASIDFAERHQIEYVEFDAGWYGPEYDDASDATTITVDPKRSPGPLDLKKVIDYANNKGIGVILYVNRRALEQQLDELLPLYKSWGVKGLKYGFVNVGSQKWTTWLHDAIRKAAEYQLMVDVHDDYRPTGFSRTYPNLMTQEGIRGDEESPSIEHSLITLFTRMLAGAGDNTNCYFAERVTAEMGGKAGQMAKSILLYSPWQFVYWYDRPIGSPNKTGGAGSNDAFIIEGDDLDFFKSLPTVWDETKVLEGAIGEFATIARRSGEDWYIGSLAAKAGRSVEVPMTFLDKGEEYEAEIYYQGKQDLNENRVSKKNALISRDTILKQELEADSGFVVILRKK